MSGFHDWLSLVDVSGLLVSEPVLHDRFPDGPDGIDRSLAYRFRSRYERWQVTKREKDLDKFKRGRSDWIRFILEQVLDYGPNHLRTTMQLPPQLTIDLTDYLQKLQPDQAIVDDDGNPLILVYVAEGDLDRPETKTGRWKASPFTKLDRLLRETDVPLGILTNGDDWRVVYAATGLTTASMTWSAVTWYDERMTLNAFRMILQNPVNLLEMSTESQDRQTDVADQLGEQVRSGLWLLVHALDQADRQNNFELLRTMPLDEIYEMSIIVMMRLLFLLYAEEHRLLPHGEVLYDQGYGITYLWTRLQRQHSENRESLDYTYDAWCQFLAVFRMVHGGVHHPDFNLLAYGGSLFDPTRFPVLEHPNLLISNATIYQMLHRLLLAEGRVGRETVMQRVSYRSLDVEQFGYMYEGLLDHVVRRADEPMLALQGVKNKQPEVKLSELESLDDEQLVDFLTSETGRSESAIINALERGSEALDERAIEGIWLACENDEALYERVLPYGDCLYDVERGMAVIPTDRLYVTEGPTRRATGTHYTPVTLTAPIVQHTLEPLVYHGPAEGLPREEWKLKTPKTLLELKICDMAMGSGAFLVQACRYMARLIDEAWTIAEYASGKDQPITIEGESVRKNPHAIRVPIDQQERDILARRLVADRCLYGVDKNRLAVEMAKLSLWLITLDKERPFTFLDHALKAGDSLVGVNIDQLQNWNLAPNVTAALFADTIREDLREVVELRQEIMQLTVNTIDDQREKAYRLTKADAKLHDLRQAANYLIASYFNELSAGEQQGIRDDLLNVFHYQESVPDKWLPYLPVERLHPFHWQLEFPEVFLDGRGGFDAFIGNPPFQGGKKITGELGTDYREYLVNILADGKRGNADVCAYFFLRAFDYLRQGGAFGLIATNTIAQGDTREVGLDAITSEGGTIYCAVNNQTWTGTAAVVVNVVHIYYGMFEGDLSLDGLPTDTISPMLDNIPVSLDNPHQLVANIDHSFIGSYVLGLGFVLASEKAETLIVKDSRNRDVLFPYLIGQDLNSNPDQSPSRWVINFFDWDLEKAEQYPDCMAIVRDKVKPQRDQLGKKKDASARDYARRWWQYGRRQDSLYRKIETLKQVLVITIVSRTVAFAFVPSSWVYAHRVAVFPFTEYWYFAVLQSSIHYFWAWRFSSTLKNDLNYAPSDCFETFPFPTDISSLEEIGETYHEIRRQIMLERWEGLTATYNRFHDPDENASDITDLRRLHVEMDHAVAGAYGWQDLALDHDFHDTAQGIRFTISEAARREVIIRLLKLNHERYAEEVNQGLHQKKGVGGKKSSKSTPNSDQQLNLL